MRWTVSRVQSMGVRPSLRYHHGYQTPPAGTVQFSVSLKRPVFLTACSLDERHPFGFDLFIYYPISYTFSPPPRQQLRIIGNETNFRFIKLQTTNMFPPV